MSKQVFVLHQLYNVFVEHLETLNIECTCHCFQFDATHPCVQYPLLHTYPNCTMAINGLTRKQVALTLVLATVAIDFLGMSSK